MNNFTVITMLSVATLFSGACRTQPIASEAGLSKRIASFTKLDWPTVVEFTNVRRHSGSLGMGLQAMFTVSAGDMDTILSHGEFMPLPPRGQVAQGYASTLTSSSMIWVTSDSNYCSTTIIVNTNNGSGYIRCTGPYEHAGELE